MSFKIKKLLYLVFLLALTVFIVEYKTCRLSRPQLITKDNYPFLFFVIGITKDKQYSLLCLVEYSSVLQESALSYKDKDSFKKTYLSRRPGVELVWNEDISKYRYYIDEKKLSQITADINSRFQNKLRYIKIRILNDDKVNKTQTVLLEKTDDDFSYYCVYKVLKGEVMPLRYGDLIKADGFEAVLTGLFAFIIGLIPYLVFVTWMKWRQLPKE